MTVNRHLGVVRLSRLTDATTSPERQREQIEHAVKSRNDAELVHIVEDLDISGSVSAWDRDVAPWLTEQAKINQWDTLIVAKLDRLSRSLLDFQKLLVWLREHKKSLIS